jgi:hypothetical protein
MTGHEPGTYSALLTLLFVYGKYKQLQTFVPSVIYYMGKQKKK